MDTGGVLRPLEPFDITGLEMAWLSCRLKSRPALGMFEVFGRTGPENLGGRAQFWTVQKLTCQFERL